MLTAKSFFLVYLGSLLVCSIVLFTLVKQFAGAFSAGGKKPVLYGSFSSIIVSLGAFAAAHITNNLFTVFWVFTAIFLSFGIVHMAINHRKYFSHEAASSAKTIVGEILFAMSVVLFTILIFSSLQYFLATEGRSFLFYPMMMSTLAFFIPILVWQTFEAAYNIPPPEYPTWL